MIYLKYKCEKCSDREGDIIPCFMQVGKKDYEASGEFPAYCPIDPEYCTEWNCIGEENINFVEDKPVLKKKQWYDGGKK